MGWTLNETVEFYKSFAKDYDNDVSKETYPAPFIIGEWVTDYLLKSSAIEERSLRILDAGCGTGQSSKSFFFGPLAERVEVHGVDGSPDMLEIAKRLPFRSLTCQNIEQPLPFNHTFDAIISVGVFDFLSDPKSLLQRLSALLESTGCLGLTLPEIGNYGLNRFGEKDIEEMFAAADLKIAAHKRFFGYKDSEGGEETFYLGYLLLKKENDSENRLSR